MNESGAMIDYFLVSVFASFVLLAFLAKMQCCRSSPDRQQPQERIDLTGIGSPTLDLSWMSQISPDLLRHHGLDHYFGQQGSLSHSITSLSMPSSREEQIASRRQYIQETLVAKKVIMDESNDTSPVSIKQEAMVKGNLHIPTKRSSSTNDQDDEENDDNFTNDNEEWTCAICWTEYQPAEDICWSPNSACAHNFHRDCIQEWLIRHDECPCCRSDYLGGGGTTTTTTTTTRTVRPPPVNMTSNNTNGGGDTGMMLMPTTNQGSIISLIDFVHMVYAMQQLYHMSPPVATRFPSTMMLRNDSNDEDGDEGDIEVGPAVEDYGLPTGLQMTRIQLEPQEDTDEPQDGGA